MTEKFQPVKGMQDYMPERMRKKQYIEDLCREVFERYGFAPLQTPVVEYFDLLAAKGSAGEAIKEELINDVNLFIGSIKRGYILYILQF